MQERVIINLYFIKNTYNIFLYKKKDFLRYKILRNVNLSVDQDFI